MRARRSCMIVVPVCGFRVVKASARALVITSVDVGGVEGCCCCCEPAGLAPEECCLPSSVEGSWTPVCLGAEVAEVEAAGCAAAPGF